MTIKYKTYADVNTSVESMALDAYKVSNIKQIPLAELQDFANELEEGFKDLDNQQYSEGEKYES